MTITNLPTDVLRTFLAVIDLGSFTKAGQLLGRTQPAISLQIRKLEDLLGMPLLDTSGRTIVLTKDGETLARYARQLLALNDEIVARLQKRGWMAVCALGCRPITRWRSSRRHSPITRSSTRRFRFPSTATSANGCYRCLRRTNSTWPSPCMTTGRRRD